MIAAWMLSMANHDDYSIVRSFGSLVLVFRSKIMASDDGDRRVFDGL